MFSNFFFLPESRAIYENYLINGTTFGEEKYGTARQATDDTIIWRMRIACWITKATHTHTHTHTHTQSI